MKDRRLHLVVRQTLGMVCVLLLFVFPAGVLFAQAPAPPAQPSPPAQALSPDQLDTLVAPVALYPDALLSQVLVAATYPLEVAEAPQWLQQNRNLQGQQLMAAARQQNWDPSIQALVAFPDVINLLSSNIRWTTDLGNAFLAQQADVMNAVQRMRAQAKVAGKLNSNAQETVTTETQGDRTAIEIQPANPQVVYVPIYDPTVVYGPWWYPAYPPYYWYPPGYVVGAPGLSFGLGVAVGAALWGGFDWGHHSVHINVTNFNTFNRTTIPNPTWRHDADHRRGVPYYDPGVRQRFGQGPRPGVDAREAFRGRAQEAPQPLAPPAPQAPRQPAALEGLGRGGETRSASDRGRLSRQSLGPTRPAPSAPVSRPSTGAVRPAPSPPRPTGGGGRTGGGSGQRR